ncbi:MAG: VWA domain-containing protein [Candidatus Obscuribacterales bacterium]|nr:VWA domain-containing protein [Candidatus Obscuribacterales bacterium]
MTVKLSILAAALFALVASLPVFALPEKKITLYGKIDEFSYLCSSAGVRLSGGGKLPAYVDKISLGSAASYSGLRQGDKVLQAQVDDHGIILSIDRKGKTYQARIATDVKGLKAQFESRKIAFSFGDSPFDKDLKLLNKCDLVLLLDRSQSMSDTHAGCPGDLSKWVWTKQQIDNFFLAVDRTMEKGFNLVLFNDSYQERKDVTLWDLRQVFDTVKPAGTRKNISLPLESVLKDYFYKRKRTSEHKPCLLVVLTDGVENVGQPLQEVLIEASKKLEHQDEVTVVFMQVGDSIFAEELFDDLDQNLVAKGARYHMVDYQPFSELRNRGLLFEILKVVKKVVTDGSSAQSK